MRIYTLGTADREPYEFTKILSKYGINVIFDVRRFPTSQFPHFKRDHLQELCAGQGTEYVFLGNELGGLRDDAYQAHMKTDEFQRGIEIIARTAAGRVCCILCSERSPARCHRRLIADALSRRGIEVQHILDETRTVPHARESRRRG